MKYHKPIEIMRPKEGVLTNITHVSVRTVVYFFLLLIIILKCLNADLGICLKSQQAKVNKTFVVQSGLEWLWANKELPFIAVTMNRATVSETLLKTLRWDLKPKHIFKTGSGAPSLHNKTEVSQKPAYSNVQMVYVCKNAYPMQAQYIVRHLT